MKTYTSCLLTGASSGLGREIAIQIVKKTSLLILLGQNGIELKNTKELCKKAAQDLSVKILCFAGDLCNPLFFQKVLELIKTHHVDLLINNAGAGLYKKSLDLPITDHEKLFQLNGWIPLHLTYKALSLWIEKDIPGTVIQIGSALAFIPSPYSATYGAAKSFIVQWSLALSEELKGQRQKVLLFCPGMIKTPFRKRASLGVDLELEGLEAREAAALFIKQLENGKLLTIVPKKDQFLLFLSHFLPLKWSLKILAKKLRVRM